MPSFVELYIDQGAEFTNTITLTNDTSNTALDLTSISFSAQMRRSYYSANATNLVIQVATPATDGELSMSLAAANTANLKVGRYVFDLKGGNVRYLQGIITVNPSVTR
jgi:hypothetical protein